MASRFQERLKAFFNALSNRIPDEWHVTILLRPGPSALSCI